jgi:hypothetical protein
MVGRGKGVGSVIAALVAAVALVAVGTAATPGGSSSRIPTLYVMYAMNCTFTFQNDAGQTVTSIPPGAYEVDVRTPVAFGTVPLLGVSDLTACHGSPMFQLTGPGVNLFTTMTAGCSVDLLFAETFQAGATYVAQDNNQASVTRTTLTIQSSGSPTSPPPITNSGVTSQTSNDIVGSGIKQVDGVLLATLAANGKLGLTLKGKPVTTLKAGSYTFTITDKDPKGSFTLLGPSSKSATNLTGIKFVGRSSKTVKLGVGRWTYYAGLQNMHYLVVTKA